MDMFVIRGGRPLAGRVQIGGAKNAALPIMAAALAAEGPTVLHDVPDLVDVVTLAGLLQSLGMRVERRADGALELEVVDETPWVADYELVRRMRASVCVLGPLLARRRRACVSLPGGCAIGDRPIDLHLKGLRALGADLRVERGYVFAEARRLRGTDIYLGGPFGSTVTGTCNVMSAAVLAEGTTTIEAAACEPEVVDLGHALSKMGAQIDGLGTPFLKIEGVERLHGIEHTIIPDRIEAATLMIAAAITRGRVEIGNVCLPHLTAVVEKLREIGVEIQRSGGRGQRSEVRGQEAGGRRPESGGRGQEAGGRGQEAGGRGQEAGGRGQEAGGRGRETASDAACLFAASNHPPAIQTTTTDNGQRTTDRITVSVPGDLSPVDCTMLPYPGLPTDVQAQLMALLTGAAGMSIVTDKVFPDRFLHAAELVRMGATIRREGPSAIVSGVPRLSGASVMASDLRASAALVLAGLAAEGESVVRRIYHLDRGYCRLEDKLNSLGADIRRVHDEPANMPASLALAALDGGRDDAEGTSPLDGPHWLRERTGVGEVSRT